MAVLVALGVMNIAAMAGLAPGLHAASHMAS